MHEHERKHKVVAEWRKYLRFWGRDVQRDIDDELRFHLEMREQDFVASGLTSRDAHDATLQRFGSVDDMARALRAHDLGRERSKRRVEVFETLAQDVRYGVRKLLQSPGFTVAVVLVLALGIGINSAMFSAVDAALLRPLPFKDADRLVVLDHIRPRSLMTMNGASRPKSAPNLDDVAAMRDVIERIGGYAPGGLNLSGPGTPVRIKVALVTPSLFPMLGATPMLGRAFAERDGDEQSQNTVIVSFGTWKSQFGGDSSVIGRSILLNNTPYVVIGVMRDKFVLPAGTEMWLPMTLPFAWKGTAVEAFQNYMPLKIIAKLASGVDAATAGKRVRALFAPYAKDDAPLTFTSNEMVLPLQATMVKDRRTALLVLMGAAALVLLTACANVTNLLLARAAARRREIEIRAALGASRLRIVQQLLTESVLLSFTGGALGIAFAYGGLSLLTKLMPPALVDIAPPSLDLRVLVFSLLLATATGVLSGLWPALGAARRSSTAVASRKSGGYAATSRDGRTLRSIFVVSEMALALMLLIGAGLMLRSFQQLVNTDSGVDIGRVATVELTLPASRYANVPALMTFYDALLQRLHRVAGVTSAAVISDLPLRGNFGIGLSVDAEGVPKDPRAEPLFPQYMRVTPEYFRVMGIHVRAGRALNEQDNPTQPVAVINQAMADALWPEKDPIGKRFALGTFPGEMPSYTTVVGVIANVRARSIDAGPAPQMYFPFNEAPSYFAGVVVRGTAESPALLAALRSAVHSVDATQPIYNLQMLDQAVSRTIAPRRTNTLLITLFGALAVVLAAFGLYAVIGYGVSQRTREIGIRIALGASVGGVQRMVLREGVVLGMFGIVIGVGGAWALSRILESMLYGVSARDPLTFVAAPVLLIGITIIATLIPARAASRVDPVKAIRTE